jgi:outer membrane murein-binding lipoprotein Lpp
MHNLSRRSQQIIKLYFAFLSCLIIGLIIGVRITAIESVNAEPTNYLNSEITNLRNRVNQLENRVIRTPTERFDLSSPSSNNNGLRTSPPAKVNGQLVGRSDPTIENLATMVIELKQQVQDLNKRVEKVEKKQ